MIEDVELIGVGMHPFGRWESHGLKDLGRVAAVAAATDADVGFAAIDAVYASNSLAGLLTGQEMIRGQTVVRDIGLEGIPVVNVENACAGGSTALREAIIAVRAGVVDRALAIGFEKMFVDDRGATLAALRTGADVEVINGLGVQFTGVYAMRLRSRIHAGAFDEEDLVRVTVKAHAHGALNPYAQHRRALAADEVAGSRVIAEPLRLLMCGSFCDGAAAVLVARGDAAPATDRPRVRVIASAARSGRTLDATDATPVSTLCANQAYEEAGVEPRDVDVFEVHDAMAPAELLCYEQLSLCPAGEAGALLRSGCTSLGGDQVVNPSGGLSARGHPVGATGLAQVAEITWQLRGEAGARQVDGARVGLAHNNGGWLEGDSAACNVHILERHAG